MVHNTHFAQFIPPSQIIPSAGTWTQTVASNIWSNNRTAAAAAFTLFVPVVIPSNSVALQGAKLVSVEVMYTIGTAAGTDSTAFKLYKNTLSPNAASGSGTINTVAEVTDVTIDTGHDTAAERYAVDEHRAVITLNTPAFIDNDEYYHVELALTGDTTSVIKVFGAIANFTLKA